MTSSPRPEPVDAQRRIEAIRTLRTIVQREANLRKQLHENTLRRHTLEARLVALKVERDEAILATRNDLTIIAASEEVGLNRDTVRAILNRELRKNLMGVQL